MATVISVEKISKSYRLGVIGAGSLRNDVNRWWAALRGRPDPLAVVGQASQQRRSGETFWALRDVDFKVQQGEVLGVIGRNGAGKSTLLKILSRVTAPTEGRIGIRGHIASLLEVGTGFHPELTGRENVFLNGAILGMRKAEIARKMDEIVAFAEIEEFLDTPVKRYSSGMYVRLAFGVAAHLEPDILIVDEVLAVGDAQFQKKCLGKMGEVAHEGRTVLFVSHNMQAVSTLTTRCLLMRGGRLVDAGPPSQIIAEYLRESVTEEAVYEVPPLPDKPRITRASIVTSEPSQVHSYGKPLTLHFEITLPKAMVRGCFSFQVVDSLLQPVVHCVICDSDEPILRTPGVHRLTCVLPSPRLYMGRYYLAVHLAEAEGGEHFESTEGICPFEVQMFGIPRGWSWKEGTARYIEDSRWEVEAPSGRGI